MKNDSVIILSGGLDSTTLLAYLKSEGYNPLAITFNYNQRNNIETDYAQYQAKNYSVSEHIIFNLPIDAFKGSSLTDHGVRLQKGDPDRTGIPNTYVPSRNLIFLSIALSLSESKSITKIFTGVNAVDFSGYPDCSPGFIESFNNISILSTKAGIEKKPVRAFAPFINMTKTEIIELGLKLKVDYKKTWTCYGPLKGIPCKICDSCLIRARAFRKLSIQDNDILFGGSL